VQLYEATGRKEEGDQWRQTLRAHKERAGK
jgi:hypothetical protein